MLSGSRPVGHLQSTPLCFVLCGRDSIEFLRLDDTTYRALHTDRAATCEALPR